MSWKLHRGYRLETGRNGGRGGGSGQEHREAGTWITITLEPGLVPGKPRALHDQVEESGWGLGNKGGEGGGSESHAKGAKGPGSVSLGAPPINWG